MSGNTCEVHLSLGRLIRSDVYIYYVYLKPPLAYLCVQELNDDFLCLFTICELVSCILRLYDRTLCMFLTEVVKFWRKK